MKTMLICLLMLNSCIPLSRQLKDLSFLSGSWKMENKEIYESWILQHDGSLIGESYQIKAGNKQLNETLSIRLMDGQLVYTATVLNQNNGQGIDFVLNPVVNDKFSFENPNHDFPKKIQYTRLNDSTLFVSVLGDQNKGFSYRMIKQRAK